MTNTPRSLGKSTLQVGRIGLGCMGMSEFTAGELADIRSRLPQETAGSRY